MRSLTLADVWQSGMVVQRNQPISIWGRGLPGASVRVSFGREQQTAIVRSDSGWSLVLAARPASAVPDSIQLESDQERIVLRDVLVGDVWLCAGQSNMAFPLANDRFARQTLPNIHNPLLRLLNHITCPDNLQPGLQTRRTPPSATRPLLSPCPLANG